MDRRQASRLQTEKIDLPSFYSALKSRVVRYITACLLRLRGLIATPPSMWPAPSSSKTSQLNLGYTIPRLNACWLAAIFMEDLEIFQLLWQRLNSSENAKRPCW